MAKTDLVRPSRDGDQFHYLWAARRCLRLLSTQSGLVAITIEGPSQDEQLVGLPDDAGEEVIDVAEYFGSEDFNQAHLIRYMQLKHSTLRSTEHWTASGLKKTIIGFAKRYIEILKTSTVDTLATKLQFWFITNRPISNNISEAVEDAVAGVQPRHPRELKKLETFTNMDGDNLTAFLKLLHFEDGQDDYWNQRNILFQETRSYLPDTDVDAPLRLKDLVTRKATSEGEKNPTITKMDILRALGTNESDLFPATCLIETLDKPIIITRTQYSSHIQSIIEGPSPIVVHASAGIGKTVFATQIQNTLPNGSTCILYDCFGNGQYRCASRYRHRHKDALVQIANELAQFGLCHPLIPSCNADTSAYVCAFVYRINQAAELIRLASPKALLCIVVDAADNAQMAAEEIGEQKAFVRDIIREKMPVNVRLVFLCRSHRQVFLDPPPETIRLELQPFSQDETAFVLRQHYPKSSEHDVTEFHRLSSQNPRVQSLALSRGKALADTLRLLGPNPTTVEDTIGTLLEDSLTKLKDRIGPFDKKQIDNICVGLAALRPLIPIPVLSKISDIDGEAIKSFATDLGRPLLVTGETIQFFDEPAETWFREKFKPSISSMEKFLDILTPLAKSSTYVASLLPQLMLEAGKYSELVDMALTSTALPETSTLEKRDIELQRLQFALKAALCTKRYLDATKLALKAGGETAGDSRQRMFLQGNTDLASVFLETNLVQEIVSRRTFGSGWLGSHHAYEASLLSSKQELIAEARSRLRMAYDWLHNWTQLTDEERKNEEISDEDIVELTLSQINVHGPAAGAHELARWKPRDVSYRVGLTVTRRLIDHGRFLDIDAFAHAAGNNLCLLLATLIELQEVHRTLPPEITKRTFRLVKNPRIKLRGDRYNSEELVLDAVIALVEAALKCEICSPDEASALLSRYLPDKPPQGLSSRFTKARFSILRAYCLRAALLGQVLELRDLASPELRDEIDNEKQHSTSSDLRKFKEDIGSLLPWHQFWASTLLGDITKESFNDEFSRVREKSKKATQSYYRDDAHALNVIALIWVETLHIVGIADTSTLATFTQWKDGLKWPIYIPTLTALARLCAQNELTKSEALKLALDAFNLTNNERSDAQSKSESYINIARSILSVSNSEAKGYFNEAVEVANKIGDENLSRWDSLLSLADRAARIDRPSPQTAHQFARCAELTYDYVVRDKHFAWQETIEALCGLCPASALTIISRWRDRNFGVVDRVLPITINRLIKIGKLDARDALPLISYGADLKHEQLLGYALSKCETLEEKQSAAAYLYRYMQFEGGNFSRLKKVISEHGVVLTDLDSHIALQEKKKNISLESGYEQAYEDEKKQRISTEYWNGIFTDFDLTDANDLSRAYTAFHNTEGPRGHDQFFREAIQRVPPGSETIFIETVANNPEFELYHIRYFLDQVPIHWNYRPAIKQALSSAIKAICRQYCLEISINRYYEKLPFQTACTLASMREEDLAEVVLDAVGNTSDLADSDRLFSLVGLLKIKLSDDEALDALKFGLDIFNPILKDSDGDGPWSNKLLPPTDIRDCLAGYIWASLAAPAASLRWEGSHAVFGLAALGRHDVLSYLANLATRSQKNPFVDSTLPFYSLHALQWFLIGIKRAAIDFPSTIAPLADQFCQYALPEQPHVMIRQLAAGAMLVLMDHGVLEERGNLKERLSKINTSQLPVIESKSHERIHQKKIVTATNSDDRFYFGIDIGPYWYKPLGEVFALSQEEIEQRALKIIRDDFDFTSKGRWDEDERARRKLYEENHTLHSHGSSPLVDTLHFYHAYHAMMIVAGNLLGSTPTHNDSEYGDEDEFTDWLKCHGLSRPDGYWLWDRRDPTPFEFPAWLNRKNDTDSKTDITIDDFDECLLAGDQLNVWGYWTSADAELEQSTNLRSALVTPDKSFALLRALSTAKDCNDYVLPCSNSNMEIDKYGFELIGWITHPEHYYGLDEKDRWAGDISFPPPMPADLIIDRMGIKTDSDKRQWEDKENSVVMKSQVWGHYDERNRYSETNPERGTRLQASIEFLTTMLTELGHDLIISVQIDRRSRNRSYSKGIEDDKQRIPTKTKIYILKQDGKSHTI